MARPGEVGRVRRSSLIGTYGPGAIVDLRSSRGAPISGVVAGLEAWDKSAAPGQSGLKHPQRVREPRLEPAPVTGQVLLPRDRVSEHLPGRLLRDRRGRAPREPENTGSTRLDGGFHHHGHESALTLRLTRAGQYSAS